MKKLRCIISGGGTGGHIYPAIAIANELKQQYPEAEILFVGAKGKMEMEKVPKAGYSIEGLWISGLQRKLTFKNFLFPFKVISSLYKARKIIQDFQPHLVIGVGGYASGPLLYAAQMAKVPSLIQEQNSFAGITNKWLAQKADRICVAYEGMEAFFPADKIVLTGNPVREDISQTKVQKREEALQFFGLEESKKTILVIGGSQGARSINQAISKGLHELVAAGAQLIWQTGKNSFEEENSNRAYYDSSAVHKTEFIYRMDLAYAAADLVISRAGALSVSELCIAAKASIFVPLPTAAEDHQKKNAEALVKVEAAEMVLDALVMEDLIPQALALLNQPEKLSVYQKNIQKSARPEASKKIVKEALELVRFP